MKKNFKLVLALVLSVMMIASMMSAMAANGDLTTDPQIKVSSLAEGDTVNLWKVLERDTTTGAWKLTSDFASLSSNANIKKLVDNDNSFTGLTQADVKAITDIAKGLDASKKTDSKTLGAGETEYTYDTSAAPGMYLALVVPTNADILYNPVIVSADYTSGGNEIDVSSALLCNAVAKKETVTIEKTTTDITLNYGEPVKFTVTTTIPAFATSYVHPTFTLSDTLSAGSNFVVDTDHPFTVSVDSANYTGGPANGGSDFTVVFKEDYLKGVQSPTSVTLTYWAKIVDTTLFNINEETNDVEVKYSHNPNDDNDHGHLKDEVKEYTFSIDGNVLYNENYKTGEVVKIGKDKAGNIIESYRELDNGSRHGALKGAVFGLYTDAECTTLYNNGLFTGQVTTDDDGLMEINGLKAGTYWLKEISAPNGYIKDQSAHRIDITYTTKTVTKTETFADCGHTTSYDIEVLKDYTVTVDGKASKYTWTADGPSISEVTPGDSSSEIANIKGVELPSTGGIGTTIFYVGGSLLVLAAAILLITKRRMSSND